MSMSGLLTIHTAVTIGDFSWSVAGGAGWLVGGVAAISLATIGFLRWNQHSSDDPFVIDGKEPLDDTPL